MKLPLLPIVIEQKTLLEDNEEISQIFHFTLYQFQQFQGILEPQRFLSSQVNKLLILSISNSNKRQLIHRNAIKFGLNKQKHIIQPLPDLPSDNCSQIERTRPFFTLDIYFFHFVFALFTHYFSKYFFFKIFFFFSNS